MLSIFCVELPTIYIHLTIQEVCPINVNRVVFKMLDASCKLWKSECLLSNCLGHQMMALLTFHLYYLTLCSDASRLSFIYVNLQSRNSCNTLRYVDRKKNCSILCKSRLFAIHFFFYFVEVRTSVSRKFFFVWYHQELMDL